MAEPKVKNIYSNIEENPYKYDKKKSFIKIEYVNQNLDEAIQEMKTSFKNNSKIIKSKPSAAPNRINPEENSNSRLYFTQTFNQKYEQKLKELDEKKKILNAASLEKQMQSRLQRKIRQNLQLKEKMKALHDLQQKKEELLTEQMNRQKKKKEQQQFRHSCSLQKFEMLRKNKIKYSVKDLKESKITEQQSLKNLRYQTYLKEKQKQEHQMLLRTKLQFSIGKKRSQSVLRSSHSQRSVKSSFKQSNPPRFAKTSQGPRRLKLNVQRQQNEQIIIKQYSPNQKTESDLEQKKYNKGARLSEQSQALIKNHEQSSKDKNKDQNSLAIKLQSAHKQILEKPLDNDEKIQKNGKQNQNSSDLKQGIQNSKQDEKGKHKIDKNQEKQKDQVHVGNDVK